MKWYQLIEKEEDVREAFEFYDPNSNGFIDRNQFKCILGNFGYTKLNAKEIDDVLIAEDFDILRDKFSLPEVLYMINKKWFLKLTKEPRKWKTRGRIRSFQVVCKKVYLLKKR